MDGSEGTTLTIVESTGSQPNSLAGTTPQPAASSAAEPLGDILCRGCQVPLYTKVTNAATAQSGKSWRCGACLQLFTVKSSAKRHVSNSHKDPVCRACQEGAGYIPPTALASVNGTGYANVGFAVKDDNGAGKSADGSSGDQDDDDQDDEMYLEPELALLTLMLKNHLDLKGVDNVLELLNGGMDFSNIHNASHWLQRLGKHAAVQYTTSNCPNCKRTEVQIKVDQTSSVTSALEGATPLPLTLLAGGRTDGVQLAQTGPGMGTVLGVFDPSSGQIITAGHVNLDKNMLQKVNTMVHNVPGQMNGGGGGGPTMAMQPRGILPPGFVTPANSMAPSAGGPAASAPRKARKVSNKPKTPTTPHPAGSVNTSWKAVARTFLQSLHTRDELLRLCVVGRRMDRTSAMGLQPMEAGKRKLVGDAVAEHCIKVGIPVPPDTLLNHFMSQILCDSRRKEQLMVCGGELQRRPKKIKIEHAEPPQ